MTIKDNNYRNFSNRAPFNNIPAQADEELVPVVLTKEMKETLKPLGFDSENVETWTFPHGKKVPVVFVPNKKGFMDIYMKFFNSEVERYLKHKEEVKSEDLDLYYDEGISGTKVEKRDGLLRLLKDCEDGKIDRVITKSISRFSRNTTDCLEMVRSLSWLGVYMYFEKENIDSEHMSSELMLSILSSIAESESRSISENSKWSDDQTNRRRGKRREKQGKCPIICQNSDKKCRKSGLLWHTPQKTEYRNHKPRSN